MHITDFNGTTAIIGCTPLASCCSGLHCGDNEFTISLRNLENYCSMDIRQDLPQEFSDRFDLIITENLDFSAYNQVPNLGYTRGGTQGFNNLLKMTREGGFLLLVGCPPQSEFRQSLIDLNLKYIECDTEQYCVLIPKNQMLDLHEIQEILYNNQLNLGELITRAIKFEYSQQIPIEHLKFCTRKQFPSFRQEILSRSSSRKLKASIDDFVNSYSNSDISSQIRLNEFRNRSFEKIDAAESHNEIFDIKELIPLANKIFKHDDRVRRAALDLLMCLTIIFPMVRLAQGKSPLFFSCQKTVLQKDFEAHINNPHPI